MIVRLSSLSGFVIAVIIAVIPSVILVIVSIAIWHFDLHVSVGAH